MAQRMGAVRQGMLSQQSETDQAATAINEMSATVQHIAEHAGTTRDQSHNADQLARAGQQVVERVEQSIAALSQGVRQSAGSIERLAEDSQHISRVVGVDVYKRQVRHPPDRTRQTSRTASARHGRRR